MFETTKKEWKPHPKQEMAITVPNTVLETFFGGAAGPGKTDCGVVLPLMKKCKYSDRMMYQHPLFKGIIMRRTIPELKKELVKRCYGFYPQTGASYNKSDRVWTWPWGAQMYLSAAEHEDDVRKYDTEQFSYEFFEELTSFVEFQYIYMISRCRPADEDLPSIVFSASNPGNIGHGWVRKRFVEPAKEGGKIIRQYFFDKAGNYILDAAGQRKYIQRIFIKALATDNPYLLKNDPDYLVKLEMLPEAEKAAKLYGDWWTFSGQVFDSFRSRHYPDEPENALHVIIPHEIPSWWPRIIAIDWGYKAATVAYWCAISPEGKAYIYREYYVIGVDVAVWATEIGELSRGENIRCLDLDTNAWESRGEPKTIAQQFQEHFNDAFGAVLQAEQATKGRISGKILVQEYLRWKPKPTFQHDIGKIFDQEEALRLKRLSENAYQKYIELFAPPEIEQNLPRLQIFNTCKQLIECIPLCIYDDKNVEDVKEWQVTDSQVGDDPYDCLRYLLKRVDRYIRESRNEFEYRAREQKVVAELAITGNQTAYYRKMESIEKKGRSRVSIRRRTSYSRLFRRPA
jgi:Terminase large subunit, T4likevirus-type, N-terminal